MSSIDGERASLTRILDRLPTTPNEQLSDILSTLLPKLLPLANNADLRDNVANIIVLVTRRVQDLTLHLPAIPLLQIIAPPLQPFAICLALNLIDMELHNYPPCHWTEKSQIQKLLSSYINAFDSLNLPEIEFNQLGDKFCNIAIQYLLPELLPNAILNHCSNKIYIVNNLSSFFLDISLTHGAITRNQPGSLQPGLSIPR